MAFPFLTIALAVALAVSLLHFTRRKLGAIIFSAIDLVVGIVLISGKAFVASIMFFPVPEILVMYLGVAITIKGIFYLILSFR